MKCDKIDLFHSIIHRALVIAIFFSFILGLPFKFLILDTATSDSIWVQTTDTDFDTGILSNVTIENSGEDAKLRLELIDLHEWTNTTSSINPSARIGYGMASVWGTDKMVLFGGYDGKTRNDTWIYNSSNSTWTEVTPMKLNLTNNPDARYSLKMVPIFGEDKVMIFGGRGDFLKLNDTWIYDLSNNTWSDQTPLNLNITNNPIRRKNYAMASIYSDDKVVLFGGDDGWFNDETWVYDFSNNTWTNKKPKNYPEARYNHAMTYICGTDSVLLFGGTIDGAQTNETWVYNLSSNTWTDKAPLSAPSSRFGHAIMSINESDKVLLFGGYDVSNDNETWIYDLSDNLWTKQKPVSSPSPRRSMSLSPIYGTNKSVVFGGGIDVEPFNDTWVYSLTSVFFNYGTHTSNAYDTGANSSFKILAWDANTPDNTTIKFQLRAAVSESGLSSQSFVGPDGSSTTYYDSSPAVIWANHNGARWIQYKAYLITTDLDKTPRLKNVTIRYNNLPITTLVQPGNGAITMNNNPNFVWSFIDPDSTQQSTFQVLVDDDSDFTSINYDSSEQSSIAHSWQFPDGTGYASIDDGIWFWKAKTKDSDGDWGGYSSPHMLWVDSKAPGSIVTMPINNGNYSSMDSISGIAFDPTNGTGVFAVEISIKRASDDNYWDGSVWGSSEIWLSTSGGKSWEYDSGSVAWSSDTQYIIRSRATDNATNLEMPGLGNIFNFDTSRPTSTIINPGNNTWFRDLDIITGSANDLSGSGIKFVEICINRSSDNEYWDGTSWDAVEAWVMATGTTVWSYNSSSIAWSSDDYMIRSKAADHVDNAEIPNFGNKFSIDKDAPSSTIDTPITDTFLNELDTISGSASDPRGSGLNVVEISVKRTSDNNYWTGAGWVALESWLLASGTTSWTYDTNKLIWTSGEQYLIKSRAMDNVNNIESPGKGNVFVFDGDQPSTTIDVPVNNTFLSALDTISGSASDTGGASVEGVEISIIRISDNYYWNGTGWVVTNIWLPVIGTDSWHYDASGDLWSTDTIYIINSRAIDIAGNIELFGAVTIFMYDDQPPTNLLISINSGIEFTNSTAAVLSLYSEDSGSGIYRMGFSTDGIVWDEWEPIASERTFTLPPNNGEVSIYFRVSDKAGNVAMAYDTIILDTIPPYSLSIQINNGSAKSNSTVVSLNLSALDAHSGVYMMRFSHDGLTWGRWELFADARAFTLPSIDGEKAVYLMVKDNAGNEAEPVYSLIQLNTTEFDPDAGDTPPAKKDSDSGTNLYLILGLIIIIIIILILIFLMIRSKTRKNEDISDDPYEE